MRIRARLAAITAALLAASTLGAGAAIARPAEQGGLRTATDRALAGAVDLSCISVEHMFYCPLLGWSRELRYVRELADAEAASSSAGKASAFTGDQSLTSQLAALDALSRASQAKALVLELRAASEAAGKVIVDDLLIHGEDFSHLSNTFPSEVRLAEESAAFLAANVSGFGGATDGSDVDAAPQVAALAGGYTFNADATKSAKQERSYWCGPASAAFFAWNDPQVGATVSHSQTTWAGYLGTTEAAGSSIYTMVSQINARLPGWKARVNTYVVNSVSGWSQSTWEARVATTIVQKRALILLHPVLNTSNSSYVPAGQYTGGHFNVGAGAYNGIGVTQKVWIFEPYFAGQVPNMVWETTSNVRLANANHPQKNIGY